MTSSNIARRQQLILNNLSHFQPPQRITVQDLQVRLENQGISASLRTLQRDLQQLSRDYPIVEVSGSGRGNAGSGWGMTAGSPAVIANLDVASALALIMARQYLQSLLPVALLDQLDPWTETARKTLSRYNQRHFKLWPTLITAKPRGLHLQPAPIQRDVLHNLQVALLENRQIEACYQGNPAQRIHPLGLINRGPVTYLVCRFFDYEDIRITAAHRFSEVQLINQKSIIPDNFDIGQYAREELLLPGDKSRKLTLTVKFSNYAGEHLKETPINDTQRIIHEKNDCLTAKFTIEESAEVFWWILGFGQDAEVISPARIRRKFAETARILNQTYSK